MQILPNISIHRLTLYLEKEKILVLSDTHIGYEEALNKQGILIPRMHLKELMHELDQVFNELKQIKTIILLGDVKHEFGTISDQEWKDTLKFLDYLLKKAKVILIKGNHDTILGPIARKKKLEIKQNHTAGNNYFCHGHKLEKIPKGIKNIIIGHEHPAISIRDEARVERYKCFLAGRYKQKNLIVMPSLNLVSEGSDVLSEKLLSPYINNIGSFKAFVVADKVYDFGRVKNFK